METRRLPRGTFRTKRRVQGRGRPRQARSSATLRPCATDYRGRGTLLSKGEAAFFGPLRMAAGRHYLIMCKVRLADVVTCSVRRDRRGPFSAISQKHLDFVLCDPTTTQVVMAVELDDRSHEQAGRRRRDAFVNQVLAAAGVRLIRFRAAYRYSIPDIRDRIMASQNNMHDARKPFACGASEGTQRYASQSNRSDYHTRNTAGAPSDSGPIRQRGEGQGR
ncbi:MAG: hypothetical protein DCC65_10665 [Planctomycetota bacterium]|nr:MAG: hypothetical protein DCC65_10665 [Planctomycetota bacterium]